MHPKMMRGKDSGIISYMDSVHGPEEEPKKKDSVVEMIECMQKQDLAGCLRTLANHFEAEETEDTPV